MGLIEPQTLQHGIIYTSGITQDFGQLFKPDPTQGRSIIILIDPGVHPQHMNIPKHLGYYVCGGCRGATFRVGLEPQSLHHASCIMVPLLNYPPGVGVA